MVFYILPLLVNKKCYSERTSLFILLESDVETVVAVLSFLFLFADFFVSMCPLKDFSLLSLPFAVGLNLFTDALFVFIFGILSENPFC